MSPRRVPSYLALIYSTTFLFRENPLPILYPISHILTRAIWDDAILVNGYTSATPLLRDKPTSPRDESYKGVLETGVVEAASLSPVSPARGCLGEVKDGTDALLGLRLLYQPTRK